ncbi:unnamed protein product, partial [Linum tenue]
MFKRKDGTFMLKRESVQSIDIGCEITSDVIGWYGDVMNRNEAKKGKFTRWFFDTSLAGDCQLDIDSGNPVLSPDDYYDKVDLDITNKEWAKNLSFT